MTIRDTIVWVLLLYVLQIFLQETSFYRFKLKDILGNRDKQPEHTVLSFRFERAKNNMLEALPLFLGTSLYVFLRGDRPDIFSLGATVFFYSRLLYVPIYAFGIPIVRSLAWLLSLVGLLIMIWFPNLDWI